MKSFSQFKGYLKEKIPVLKGIIFDCDGVLIDSRNSNVRYYNMIKEKLGLPPMNKEEENFVHTHTVFESIKFIVPQERYEEALEISKSIPYEKILELIRLENGLVEFLNLLKEMNIKMAVNTNRTTTMELILEKFNLKGYFDPVITANKLMNPKPHPESVNLILKHWGLKPNEVTYIGDSEVDEKTARNGDIDFWSYKNFLLKADLYIPDYNTLHNWFQKIRNNP